jgi:EPS-associated MarR family transcriptional regulator
MEKREYLQEDAHLKVLRLLEKNPQMTQRELAQSLGVSLGKANFCIQALLQKGLIKLSNFQSSRHKLAYAYFLTPAGIAEKSAITARFLKRKIVEYEQLQADIAELRQELGSTHVAQQMPRDIGQS